MCGLVSVVGYLDTPHEKMFKLLLQLDTMRGSDSTGMLSVSTTNTSTILKGIGTPWDLADHKKYDNFFLGWHKLLMGHNRSATRGSVTVANAHPFEFEGIIGAHNGTLRSTFGLDGHNQFNVDSEVLFNHIDINGIEDAVAKADGAFALTYYDKLAKTFSFIRNDERPLYYVPINDGKIYGVASEAWMLSIAASYANVKIGEIQSVPVGELFTIRLPVETHKVADTQQQPLVLTRRTLSLKKDIPVGRGTTGTNDTTTKKYSPVSRLPSKTPTATAGSSVSCRKQSGLLYGGFEAKFEVTGWGKTQTNQPYISGRIVHADGHQLSDLYTDKIRAFPTMGTVKWEEMLASSNYFKGQVKAHSNFDGGYYTIGLSSIEEVAFDDDSQDLYEGYGGVMLTIEGFKRATADGCMTCGIEADPKDSGLVFTAMNQHICGSCVSEWNNERNYEECL